jgi:hypothetical protein
MALEAKKIMDIDTHKILEDFVDYLMPELTPHESSMYIFLFRNSYLRGDTEFRIGQRTFAQKYGRGPKMAVPSRAHVQRQLLSLEEKGCIKIGDINREGTLYEVYLPTDISLVIEKQSKPTNIELEDFYTNKEKRKEIYEKDNWICQYCGEKVTPENVTLDHYVPQCKGGTNEKSNLRTSCLLCNSIKSGKSYEDAAVYLLKSIQERRIKGGGI